MSKPKIIAFYLPQFYPVEINDKLYGKGFTEWRNVANAKRLYPGHYQPHIPADLGFYDLRVDETREAQAKLAKEHGVYGFCYWHYWLGNGVEFLEKPVQAIMRTRKPDFPFCLAWANHDWKSNAFFARNAKTVIKQEYPGEDDYVKHFYSVLPCFKDERYIKVDGKPVFMIYQPTVHKDIPILINLWRKLAIENGLEGMYFIGHLNNDVQDVTKNDVWSVGVDAINTENIHTWMKHRSKFRYYFFRIFEKIFNFPRIIPYKKALKYFIADDVREEDVFPSVIPNWDNTPRRKGNGVVFTGSSPDLFKEHLQNTLNVIKDKPDNRQIIFLKSWNEWAEGNYVEPDMKYGLGYLEAIRDVLSEYGKH